VLGLLKLFGELLVGGAAVEEALVNGARDLGERARRLDEGLDQAREVVGQRHAGGGGAAGELGLGVLGQPEGDGDLGTRGGQTNILPSGRAELLRIRIIPGGVALAWRV
jgi:hypothetical protein